MNVLLLGNGFDLYHHLPTKYINFLNTVNYLSSNYLYDINTVGDIFSNSKLHDIDKDIKKSYETHREAYHNTPLNLSDIQKLFDLPINNLWFSYLSKSFNKDIGWIDFEAEISTVLQAFQELLTSKTDIILHSKNDTYNYIIKQFDFFIDHNPRKGIAEIGYKRIQSEYSLEYPLGSGHKILNKENIVKHLYNQLLALAEGLRIYLKLFVDNPLEIINDTTNENWKNIFQKVKKTITFNYTNTFEKLYNNTYTIHLHGNVNSNIILGVNPDSCDNVETADISLISFKKYFQRVKYKTDVEYISFIKSIQEKLSSYVVLYVIGHSLDVTDRDIIEKMFSISNKIYVLNYNNTDESKHISNLVKIFGKSKFDEMRFSKDLTFLPIDADISKVIDHNFL